MSEREPKIQSAVFEEIDITGFIGTVSEPTHGDGFEDRLMSYAASVARRHPSHPELHEHEVGEEDMAVALMENRILERFHSQFNIIDYYDIGSEFLAQDPGSPDENHYNIAWMRFVTAMEFEPRSRVRSMLLK